jgi:serine/threonine-protein kinase RsbW
MRRESWLPAAPEGVARARALVRELSSELRFDGVTTWELMLATSEAFANAVEHGRSCDPRGILLLVEIGDGRVGVEVADCGGCFPDKGNSTKRRGEGGRGLRIIAAIMDQLEVVPDTGATRVRFAKRLATA